MRERMSVLVVGGDPVAYGAAAVLADLGVPVLLVQGPGAPYAPLGRGRIGRRTAEVLRLMGVVVRPGRVDRARLAAVLRDRAVSAGAVVESRQRLLAVGPDLDRVTVLLRDSDSGVQRRIRCRYLVSTDPRWTTACAGQFRWPVGRTWPDGSWLAHRYRTGRLFVAGDAAHRTAASLDIGLSDVHNLGWKLAAVLTGQAGPALLDSYDTERRPVARQAVEQARRRLRARAVGYRYQTGALLHAFDPPRPAVPAPGQVGTPALGAPVLIGSREVCARTLVGGRFTLFTGPQAGTWSDAAKRVASTMNVPMDVYRVGADVVDRWGALDRGYGLGPVGASLVRPDGFVAWRVESEDGQPERAMEDVMRRLLCR